MTFWADDGWNPVVTQVDHHVAPVQLKLQEAPAIPATPPPPPPPLPPPPPPPVPQIIGATFDGPTGDLVVTGSDFMSVAGSANDIALGKFTVTGEGGREQAASRFASTAPAAEAVPTILLVDGRALPNDSTLEFEGFDLTLVDGAIRALGSNSADRTVGSEQAQFFALAGGNDVNHAGKGDDTVGGSTGDDELHGDDGDDHLVGGAGDDRLEGGDGNDVLQGDLSDAGDWTLQLGANGQVVTRFQPAEALLNESEGFVHEGAWGAADARLAFSNQSAGTLKTVAVLYHAVTGASPSLGELNDFSGMDATALQLAQAAYDFHAAHRPASADSVQAQVELLIEAVWGEGTATNAFVAEGAAFIANGGTWAQGLLALASDERAAAGLLDADGNLLLSSFALGETGWSNVAGSDTLVGGAGNDRLVGGFGNVVLDGGAGMDLAAFLGALADYGFTVDRSGDLDRLLVENKSTGEVDTLSNIEVLQIGARYHDTEALLSGVASVPVGIGAVEVGQFGIAGM